MSTPRNNVEDLARKEGVSAESRVVEGIPAEESIKKYLIGSVADKVVRHSKIPVLTVKK